MKKKPMTYSCFICTNCGNTYFLGRDKGKQRKNGHIKDLWCPVCKEVTKHIEEKDAL